MKEQEGLGIKERAEGAFKDAQKIDLRNEIQEAYGEQPLPWFAWVFNLLQLPAQSRILELGCGTGPLWEENLPRIPRSWEIILTDRSTTMLRSARESLDQPRFKERFLGVDSMQLPFADARFDAVIAVGLLDLLPDLASALRDIWRVLKPSGVFLATAGGKGHLKELGALVRPYLPEEHVQMIGGDERHFGLENGADRLSTYFDEITRNDYRDRMVFTEYQPVLDYVLSEQIVAGGMTLEQLSSFVQRVKNRLARNGSLEVTIRKGAFIARKGVAASQACK